MLFPPLGSFHILYGDGHRKGILSQDLFSGKLVDVFSCIQRPHDVTFSFMRQRYLPLRSMTGHLAYGHTKATAIAAPSRPI